MSPRVASQRALAASPLGLGLDPQQLLAVVPLVERLRLVEALVALQAHQPAAGGARERLGQLGLADARRALDQDRLAEPLGEEGDQRGGLVGQVADLAEALADLRRPTGARGSGICGDDRYAPCMLATRPARLARPLRGRCSPSDSSVGWYGHGGHDSNWIVAFGIVVILAAIGLLQLAHRHPQRHGRRPAF